MATPLLNLRVPAHEREAWVRAAAGESLSRWVRRVCNEAAGVVARAPVVAGPGQVPRRGVVEHRPEHVREADAWLWAQQAEAARLEAAGSPGRMVKVPESDPPAPSPAEQDPRWRPGRCRDHPNALPRFNDVTRCAWGCRLPDD